MDVKVVDEQQWAELKRQSRPKKRGASSFFIQKEPNLDRLKLEYSPQSHSSFTNPRKKSVF
jgi:hypothetical protein